MINSLHSAAYFNHPYAQISTCNHLGGSDRWLSDKSGAYPNWDLRSDWPRLFMQVFRREDLVVTICVRSYVAAV